MLNQVHRVILVIIALIVFVLILREIIVPEDFGLAGHFRYSNIKEWEQFETKLVGKYIGVCDRCHTEEVKKWQKGIHASISCETCHALIGNVEEYKGKLHVENPMKYKMNIGSKELCLRCHEKLESRPKFIKQIVSNEHSKNKMCNICHDPHNPIEPMLISKYRSGNDIITNKCNPCHLGTVQRLSALVRERGIEEAIKFLYDVEHPGSFIVKTIEKSILMDVIKEVTGIKYERRIEFIEKNCNICHLDTIEKLKPWLKGRGINGTMEFLYSKSHPGNVYVKEISKEELEKALKEVM